MITVTDQFTEASRAAVRKPTYQVNIDWQLNGVFANESYYVTQFSYQRSLEEPMTGISAAIADVTLANNDDRYLRS